MSQQQSGYDSIVHESLFVHNLLALGNRNYNVMYQYYNVMIYLIENPTPGGDTSCRRGFTQILAGGECKHILC